MVRGLAALSRGIRAQRPKLRDEHPQLGGGQIRLACKGRCTCIIRLALRQLLLHF